MSLPREVRAGWKSCCRRLMRSIPAQSARSRDRPRPAWGELRSGSRDPGGFARRSDRGPASSRRGNTPRQPCCSSLTRSARAAMSWSWPLGERHARSSHNAWDSRERLHSGCCWSSWRICSNSAGPSQRPCTVNVVPRPCHRWDAESSRDEQKARKIKKNLRRAEAWAT
jgi:hypothetical protein